MSAPAAVSEVWPIPVVTTVFSSGFDTMLPTVTAVLRFTQYNGTVSPSPLDNTSTFPTWHPDTEANITKPHKCLQVLYEDVGNSRCDVYFCKNCHSMQNCVKIHGVFVVVVVVCHLL